MMFVGVFFSFLDGKRIGKCMFSELKLNSYLILNSHFRNISLIKVFHSYNQFFHVNVFNLHFKQQFIPSFK